MDWLDIGGENLSSLGDVERRPGGVCLIVVSTHVASMAAMADLWRKESSLLLGANVLVLV